MARLGWLRRLGLGQARPAARRENAAATPGPRLVVEALEDRLPPGDAVGGLKAIAEAGAAPVAVEPQPAPARPVEIVAATDKPEDAPVSSDPPAVVQASFAAEANNNTLPQSPPTGEDPMGVMQSASAAAMSVHAAAASGSARAAGEGAGEGHTHSGSDGSGTTSTPAGGGGSGTTSAPAPTSGDQSGRTPSTPRPGNDPKAGLLGSQHLIRLHEQFTDPENDEEYNPNLQVDIKDRVLIQARSTGADLLSRFTTRLKDLGMEVVNTSPDADLVTGWLPITAIPSLTSVPTFSSALPVFRPVVRTGLVTSEGDFAMGSNMFRLNRSVNGAGIKVGVLSDSVNQVGGGLADSQATGDLPPVVEVLSDGGAGSTDEGRAMLEIVHDVAPGSQLAFYSANNGAADFANGIRALYAAGARVITDDIGYLNSPMFSVGRMGQAIAEVTAGGAVYTTAAGNDGDNGWRADWDSLNTTVDGVTGNFQNFNGSALQTFTLGDNESVDIGFRWSEAYLEGGDNGANFQVDADYAVYVVNADTGTIVATQDDDNANTDEAFELVSFTNDGSFGTNNFALAFRLKGGPPPKKLGWVQYGGPEIDALDGGGPTEYGQVLAPSALAVAAAPVNDITHTESYSSLGGELELFSDENGNVFDEPLIVTKPDVTGPDGVSTTFFGQQVGLGFKFFGTSAAAPHVAAAAALLMQQAPSVTGVDVANHLRLTAMDIEAPGVDAQSGHGFVHLIDLGGVAEGVPDTGPTLPPDALEDNDTSETAQELGILQPGTRSFGDLAISPGVERLADFDWYKITMPSTGTFTVSAQGFEDGLTLEAHLFVRSNGMLTEVSASSLSPTLRADLTLLVTPATTVYIEIKGASNGPGGFQRGGYTMNLSLSEAAASSGTA